MNIIFALIALVTGVNIGSYFVLSAKAPIYTVFLGTVHYPLDYLDYLSYITQGKWHWLRSYALFTGETTHLEFLNWPYVLAGHIASWFGFTPGVTYIIMVAAGTILYLLVAYKLITLLIPASAPKRLLLFILFLLSNEFPNIYQTSGHWVFAYFYPFENWGEPLIRLTNVPHQILIQTAIMASLVLSAMYWQKKLSLKRMAVLTFVTGLVLASLQPLQWAFVTGVVGVVSLFQWWKTKKIDVMFPSVILGLGGLIPALYLKHLFTYPPYSYTIAWEASQQTYITFRHFVELNGPLMILAIVGIPFIITMIPVTGAAIILYTIIAIAIFFSTIPQTLHMMNNRFFSVIPTMAFAYISTEFLYKIAKKVDPARPMVFAW